MPSRATAAFLSLLFLAVCGAAAYHVYWHLRGAGGAQGLPEPRAILRQAAEKPILREVVGIFRKNENITEALVGQGLSLKEVQALVASAKSVYNLARVAAGRPYWLNFSADGSLHDLRYPVDEDRYLTVYRKGEEFVPELKNFAFETRIEPVSGAIRGSLFASVKDAGEQEQLALDLADIFTWDIDFYTEIQNGDAFRLIVEKKYVNGSFVRYGAILAAALQCQDRTLTGFRFHDENGKPGYYGPDGTALRKSFLKSPLKFGRITSGFSRARRHPILKIVRPHLGVDYAAPTGTPVVAVAAGRVQSAGYAGGGGKTVRLQHDRNYQTCYLHLSRIAVKAGRHVSQGQVIGYVGSTGLSTGPHLDFRVLQSGKYVNPARVVFPPAPPVAAGAFTRFAELRDSLRDRLDSLR